MTNSKRVKTAKVNRRGVTASLLLGGAVGFLSLTTHAESAKTAPPQMAITAPAAPSTGGGQPPKVQPFQTAPLMVTRQEPSLVAPGSDASSPVTAKVSALSEPVTQSEDVFWALTPEQRPWALAYVELMPLNTLYFTLPSERDARMMLPGASAEAADLAKFTASRYITDNIGLAEQVRTRQLEGLNTWASHIETQKASTQGNEWAAFQFNKEMLAILKEFKKKVAAQSAPGFDRMATDINAGVTAISGVIEVTSAYDIKMRWYNVLVQLKDGMGLYVTRVNELDSKVLTAIAAIERNNPPLAQPMTPPPARPVDGAEAASKPIPAASLTPATPREVAKPLVEPAKSGTSNFIILGVMSLAAFGIFMKLRKRVSKTGATKKAPDA